MTPCSYYNDLFLYLFSCLRHIYHIWPHPIRNLQQWYLHWRDRLCQRHSHYLRRIIQTQFWHHRLHSRVGVRNCICNIEISHWLQMDDYRETIVFSVLGLPVWLPMLQNSLLVTNELHLLSHTSPGGSSAFGRDRTDEGLVAFREHWFRLCEIDKVKLDLFQLLVNYLDSEVEPLIMAFCVGIVLHENVELITSSEVYLVQICTLKICLEL